MHRLLDPDGIGTDAHPRSGQDRPTAGSSSTPMLGRAHKAKAAARSLPGGRAAGILMMLAASACYAVMGALVKAGLGTVSVMGVVFWRSLVVMTVAWVLLRWEGASLKPGHGPWLALRCVAGFTAMSLFFTSIGTIDLGTAHTLVYMSPIVTVVLAALVLGERLYARTIPLVVLGFVGVLLIVRPGAVAVEAGTWMGLAAGVLAAVSYIAVRRLRGADPPARIVFWFAAFSVVLSGLGYVWWGPLHGLSGRDLALLLGAGLAATGGQMLMTWSYRVEQAQVVGPFSYFTVVGSVVLGWAVWGEQPTGWSLTGMGCVILSGTLLSGVAKARDQAVRGKVSRHRAD
ncbi:MAG: DMT family transporter [Myxococcota bacterium]